MANSASPNTLQQHRVAMQLTQLQVAQKLGIHSKTLISRWESGEIAPTLTNLIKLLKLYNTTLIDLYPEQWGEIVM